MEQPTPNFILHLSKKKKKVCLFLYNNKIFNNSFARR